MNSEPAFLHSSLETGPARSGTVLQYQSAEYIDIKRYSYLSHGPRKGYCYCYSIRCYAMLWYASSIFSIKTLVQHNDVKAYI
jgi:hypothetical protein